MAVEIERKFLVQRPPHDLEQTSRKEILQGYLAVERRAEVRLRRTGERHLETVKGPGTLARSELEIELTRDQFQTLWPATEGRRVNKTRYRLQHGQALIEIDVYRDGLEGLVTAEVEFSSLAASAEFVPPDWFGTEVTRDDRYKNRNLAEHGLPDRSPR